MDLNKEGSIQTDICGWTKAKYDEMWPCQELSDFVERLMEK